MSEKLTENTYHKKVEMRVIQSDKNKQYVNLEDLIVDVMESMGKEQLASFLLRMFSWDESINALKGVLNGDIGTDENNNNADVLRMVCLEHSSEAVKVLLINALEEAHEDRQRVIELKNHIEKLESEWPESYKRYMPKKDYFFPKYIDASEQAQKMIDEVQG
ncbi:MAG: hypothetical protein E6Q97_13225 [Desulfurellales bacterium]|nr:MAG: hypothetical protein E6Q97_13225 [Desulfurellales bacterium]